MGINLWHTDAVQYPLHTSAGGRGTEGSPTICVAYPFRCRQHALLSAYVMLGCVALHLVVALQSACYGLPLLADLGTASEKLWDHLGVV